MDLNCSDCKYFFQQDDDMGDCHANPPAIITGGVMFQYHRPSVDKYDLPCRHFVELEGSAE
jgi:hypothetical protein